MKNCNRLNQSVAPTFETDLNVLIPKPHSNVKVLNLNNLDTSLTKEFDKNVLSNVNSAKHKQQSQSTSVKNEKVGNKDRPDTSQRSEKAANNKKPFFSPTPKNAINDGPLIHARHTSNPEVLNPHFMKERYS